MSVTPTLCIPVPSEGMQVGSERGSRLRQAGRCAEGVAGEAERTTEKAQTALEATKRAAAAATVAVDAIAEMAREAELTLQAAERARDVSLRAAVEAGAALDLANGELVGGETAATDAQAAFEAAREEPLPATRRLRSGRMRRAGARPTIQPSHLRGRIEWRAPECVFTASLALMSFAVFNQQVITGRSLQPFHYESFIANYLALVAVIVASVIIWRGREGETKQVRYGVVRWIVFVSFWWAAIEIMAPTKVIKKDNLFIDRAAAVCQRLRERAMVHPPNVDSSSDSAPLVLASDNKVAVLLPTFAPQAVLWAPHFDFLDLRPGESRQRFYQYLYYTGVEENRLTKDLHEPMSTVAAAAFGHERVIPDLAVKPKPITDEEITTQVSEYKSFYSSFSRDQAVQHILSYVIVPVTDGPDLANLDRWYQRDEGEQVGNYILYRVQLRP